MAVTVIAALVLIGLVTILALASGGSDTDDRRITAAELEDSMATQWVDEGAREAESNGIPADTEVIGTRCTPVGEEPTSSRSEWSWTCTIEYQGYYGFEPNRLPLPEVDSGFEVEVANDGCWSAISETGEIIEDATSEEQAQLEGSYLNETLEACP